MDALTTRDPRVIEMLKSLGMPEKCTRATINFPPGGVVSIEFERLVGPQELETLNLLVLDGKSRAPGDE